MTEQEYFDMVGHKPSMTELEIANCPLVNTIGHINTCGVCEHGYPVYHCVCPATICKRRDKLGEVKS